MQAWLLRCGRNGNSNYTPFTKGARLAFSVGGNMETVWQAEDSLREKKVESDLKDLLKTLVAFANSVAPGDTAKIFIGEKDNGDVQGVTDTDSIQKSVKKEADKIYPGIYYRTEVYERDGKSCVRVEVKHNGLAPHFAGAAWVRRGSETILATEDLYQQMVDARQSKTHELLRWLNKEVTAESTDNPNKVTFDARELLSKEWALPKKMATIAFVNSYWVTFRVRLGANVLERSEPMERLVLSWDDERNRLKVFVKATP
jgi:Putative DNA-binding domain